ncbi:uncharacterized protein BN460_01623 [Porphyromonas sp. CAG:1061]|nr:uncharacterized protein BN460_01623 [Porphyromonas sp. CAG:1061]
MRFFPFGKKRAISLYATQIVSAFLPTNLFVLPANEFCSCTKVGIFSPFASKRVGALAYPPTPITICGRILFSSLRICCRLLSSFQRVMNSLMGFLPRLNPSTGSKMISYPAAGTFSSSIRPLAPTKVTSHSGYRRFISLAIEMAGNICPPVPPPLMITLVSFVLMAPHFLLVHSLLEASLG